MQVLTGADLRNMLLAASQYLEKEKETINALNVFPVPDGDTGTNMALTLSAAVRELDTSEEVTVDKISAEVARGSLMGARGNSGVILSQFFRGLSEGFSQTQQATGSDLARALGSASQTTYRAVMKPVEGTMLTVAKAAAEGAEEAAKGTDSVVEVFVQALSAAQAALAETPNILPVLKQAGVVDAGGKGLVIALAGALAYLQGENLPSLTDVEPKKAPSEESGISAIVGDLANHYCTEFLIKGSSLNVDCIRERLESEGDSLLVVGDSRVVKVHVHTDYPGKVLDYATKQGEIVDIKIDNMKQQNEAIVSSESSSGESDNLIEFPESTKALGVVAVVPGDGLAEIFVSLGVDKIVAGGQTMNPSTEQLVKAVLSVNADSVIILPNNKNIIFAAQQVKQLVDKDIGVIPTRSVPQGIGALINLDLEASLDENLVSMENGLQQVKTGEVTYAVRSTKAGDLQIEEQDIIGLREGKIAVAGGCVQDVSLELLSKMVDEDSSVISIYYGNDLPVADAESFAEKITESYPECEVEVYSGGQPLYYYIMSVE